MDGAQEHIVCALQVMALERRKLSGTQRVSTFCGWKLERKWVRDPGDDAVSSPPHPLDNFYFPHSLPIYGFESVYLRGVMSRISALSFRLLPRYSAVTCATSKFWAVTNHTFRI